MKRIHKLIACFLSVILACVVITYFSAERVRSQDQSKFSPRLSSTIPLNPRRVSFPNDQRTDEEQFGNFAWETFAALNWPADCPSGSPLKDQIGQAPNQPRVWEFYNFPKNIFLDNAEDPTIKKDGQGLTLKKVVVPYKCRASTNSKSDLDEISIYVPGDKPGVRDTVLVDRAGNYILNEIRMNPVEVNQIVDKKWYSAKNLKQFDNNYFLPNKKKGKPFQLMCSNKDEYPQNTSQKVPCSENKENKEGAIELKASWMVINPDTLKNDQTSQELRSQYYITKRTFDVDPLEPVNPNGKVPITVDVGLVGFHMAIKTSQTGWIWATFEHINNLPNPSQDSSTSNLLDLDCQQESSSKDQCTSKFFRQEAYLWRRDQFPYAVTTGGKKQTPAQITRLYPIDKKIQNLNTVWKQMLPKVWKNYQLVGVQWLGSPYEPYNTSERRMIPQTLANVTIEPFIQSTKKGSSCVTCHSLAALPALSKFETLENLKGSTCAEINRPGCSDFSFLFSHAK